jgi:hypothetical protein
MPALAVARSPDDGGPALAAAGIPRDPSAAAARVTAAMAGRQYMHPVSAAGRPNECAVAFCY